MGYVRKCDVVHYFLVLTQFETQYLLSTGTYITSADALDMTVSEEDIWANNDFERAIALVATRSLFYERAGGLLGPDKELMHGTWAV